MPNWTAFVTVAALLVYFWMSMRVGFARRATGIAAPATSGHPDLDRAFRAHMNTLEWLPIFLPLLWMTAVFVDDRFAALLGLVWIGGRVDYALAYAREPAARSRGFSIQTAVCIMLMAAVLVGVARSLIAG